MTFRRVPGWTAHQDADWICSPLNGRQPVSTACSSGWVANLHPPAIAGGTDPAPHAPYLKCAVQLEGYSGVTLTLEDSMAADRINETIYP
jgi:hypothetical protein